MHTRIIKLIYEYSTNKILREMGGRLSNPGISVKSLILIFSHLVTVLIATTVGDQLIKWDLFERRFQSISQCHSGCRRIFVPAVQWKLSAIYLQRC